MADNEVSKTPTVTPEQRRIAVGQYERANQVIATGNHDYGIQLLLTCCKLDPTNIIYRRTLRQTEKNKYKNNMKGSRLATLSTATTRAKIKAAKGRGDYLKVLEYGEEILTHNPWDIGAQTDMAEAAVALDLMDLGVWFLEMARQKDPQDLNLLRAVARVYEKRGDFSKAINAWALIRKLNPRDTEAQKKAKDLAASDTIARGGYESGGNTNALAQKTADAAQDKPGSKEQAALTPAAARMAQETAPLLARIEKDPTNFGVYLQLAAIYRRNNHKDKAREILQQGLGPTSNQFELAIELAELEIEPFRENLVVTEDKLKANPKDEELRKLRPRVFKEINTRELDIFRQKADRFPTEKTYRFELGVRLLRTGQVDEAIRELQALRADPRHQWRALLYLGYCFKQRNNWRLAQRNFEEALQNLPQGETESRKEIMFQIAQGCADNGDLSHAMDIGYELANMDYSYRDIGRLLDEWQKRKEEEEKEKEADVSE